MEIDTSGSYSPSWGYFTRKYFYNVTGTPTTWFDGITKCAGAYSTSQQMYTWYKNAMQARKAIPTDVAMEMSAFQTGDRTLDVSATVHLEVSGAAKTMRIYMVQVLDDYPSTPYYARNSLRQVVEDGFDITLNPGESDTITRSVTFDSVSWNRLLDIKMIAWAQMPNSTGPADIFNAAQLPIYGSIPLPGDFNFDGFVNSNDLAIWQNGFGTTTGALFKNGDADTDGDVAGNDFLIWQQHRGEIVGSSAASSTAIPEPATWILAI
ncbi:MAG: hypothetical protein JW829_15510, partial [Pirellulales bacterium]|nr:hypothetical protein [Pirellulales bacterium]